MKISSNDIPQADDLSDVLHAVEAVARGADTYGAIAATIGKVERQGRYYRRAGEILGFIRNYRNQSVLTPLGKQYLNATGDPQRAIVTKAVLSAPIFQRVIPFLEANGHAGVDRSALERFLSEVTEKVGETMIHRRASTILSWLQATGIVREIQDKAYLVARRSSVPPIEFRDDEPLLPPRYDLQEYAAVAQRARSSKGSISVMIDIARRERAAESHVHLVNCVASKIIKVGSVPRFNRFVDLAATIQGSAFLFEVKSSTVKNYHAQFRRAISQLYEYRYLQKATEAKLVVVMEHAPNSVDRWLIDYAVSDRNLLVVWNGDGDRLFAAPGCDQELRFLV